MPAIADSRRVNMSAARVAAGYQTLYGVFLLPLVVDANARFVRVLIVTPSAFPAWTLKDAGDNTLASGNCARRVWSLTIDVADLADGTYTVNATGGYSRSFSKTSTGESYTLGATVALSCPSAALSGHTGTDSWPVHVFLPLPVQQGDLQPWQIELTENGAPITTSAMVRQSWNNNRPRIVHCKALAAWTNGATATYAVRHSTYPASQASMVSRVGNVYTIATGVATIQIDRVKGGIVSIVKDGVGTPLGTLSDWAGAFATDERSVTHYVASEQATTLRIEDQGNAHCTLRHEGWLKSAETPASRPLRFSTLYTFYRGSGVVEIDHSVIFACDMQAKSFAEIGYRFPAAVASCSYDAGGSTFSENATGGDPAIWRAHSYDASTITRNSGSTSRAALDGVFSLRSASGANAAASFFVRDFSERYPAGAQLTTTDFRIYAYPPGLSQQYNTATRTALKNIVLGLPHHDGPRLSCAGDADVIATCTNDATFNAERIASGDADYSAQFQAAGNASGRILRQRITLVVSTTTDAANKTATWKQLHSREPVLLPSAQYIGDTAALGEDFSPLTDDTELEDRVVNGYLAAYNPARQRMYGWLNYGDCHESEWVEVDGSDRVHFSRPWMANHYGTSGGVWYNAIRAQNDLLLALARRIGWHFCCIDSIAYDDMTGPLSGGQRRPKYRGHYPGAAARPHIYTLHLAEGNYGSGATLDTLATAEYWSDITPAVLGWLIGGDWVAKATAERRLLSWLQWSPPSTNWGVNRSNATNLAAACWFWLWRFEPQMLHHINPASVMFDTVLPSYSGGAQTVLYWPLLYEQASGETSRLKTWSQNSLNAAPVVEGIALAIQCSLSARGNVSPTKATEIKRIFGGIVNRGHIEPGTAYDGYGMTLWLDDFGASQSLPFFGKIITGTGGGLRPFECCYPFPAGTVNSDADPRWLYVYVNHSGGVLSFDWRQDTSFPGNQSPPIEVKVFSPNGSTQYALDAPGGPTSVYTQTGYRVSLSTYQTSTSVPAGLVAIRVKCGAGVLYGPLTQQVEASCWLRDPVGADHPSHAAFRVEGYLYPRAASISLTVDHWNPGQTYEGKTPIRVIVRDKDANTVTDTTELRRRRNPVTVPMTQAAGPYSIFVDCYANSRPYMRVTSATNLDRIATFSLNSTDCVTIAGLLTSAGL